MQSLSVSVIFAACGPEREPWTLPSQMSVIVTSAEPVRHGKLLCTALVRHPRTSPCAMLSQRAPRPPQSNVRSVLKQMPAINCLLNALKAIFVLVRRKG